ncbi:MAG: hypothetical protein ACRD2E_10850 [Terriglobales bacterium]
MNLSSIRCRTSLAAAALAAVIILPARAQKPSPCPAPKPAPQIAYRLDYTIQQIRGGRAINARHYDLLVREGGQQGSLRVGNRIPMVTGSGAQIKYAQVGVSIYAMVVTRPGGPVLESDVSVTSASAKNPAEFPVGPVTKGFSMDTSAPIHPNSPMVLATMDDVSSNDQFRVSVTAIPQPR